MKMMKMIVKDKQNEKNTRHKKGKQTSQGGKSPVTNAKM